MAMLDKRTKERQARMNNFRHYSGSPITELMEKGRIEFTTHSLSVKE
jgi:hypothetical protein